MSSFTLESRGGLYTPIGQLSVNEQVLVCNVLDALNETEERAGMNASNFLYRGSIEDVKKHKVKKPLNTRWF
jgi:hypothetical protein